MAVKFKGKFRPFTRCFRVRTSLNLAPIWTTASTFSAYESTNLSKQLVAVDPEGAPVAYTVTGGALPTGVTLSPSGLLSGSLGAMSTDTLYAFTVSASDGLKTATRAFSFTVLTDVDAHDPNWSSVAVMMPFEGANGSTTFTDVKGARNFTSVGSGMAITSDGRFGSAANFPGTGGLALASFAPLGSEWTIEGWFYLRSAGQTLISQFDQNSNGNNAFLINYDASGRMSVNFSADGGYGGNVTLPAYVLPLNTWVHLAFCVKGGTLYSFANGILTGAATLITLPTYSSTRPLMIGCSHNSGAYGFFFNGKIDDLRITRGVARFTKDFAIPTSPFTVDSDTQQLVHFENWTGTQFTDEIPGKFYQAQGTVSKVSGTGARIGTFGGYLQSGGKIVSNTVLSIPKDFTLEFYIKLVTATNTLDGVMSDGNYKLPIYMKTGQNAISYSGSASTSFQFSNPTLTTGIWYHIAIVRNGAMLVMCVDGKAVGAPTSGVGTIVGDTVTASTSGYYIGYVNAISSGNTTFMLDEFRLSTVARYKPFAYPVPTKALPTQV